ARVPAAADPGGLWIKRHLLEIGARRVAAEEKLAFSQNVEKDPQVGGPHQGLRLPRRDLLEEHAAGVGAAVAREALVLPVDQGLALADPGGGGDEAAGRRLIEDPLVR